MSEMEQNPSTGDCEQDRPPACFGRPENVCPRDESGIIQPQAACRDCKLLRSCLQQALRTEGVLKPPPVVSKVGHFLKRWSNQKLSRTDTKEGGSGS